MIARLAKARAAASARFRARLARVSRRQLRPRPLIAHEEVRSGRNSQDDRSWPRYLSALPEDARAVLEPLPTATNQGGRARKGQWRLSFPQRKKPFVDWLMGWTGGEDPLVQVDLRFPTREAAERYCERLNLPYDVHEPPRAHTEPVNKQRFQLDDAPIAGWPDVTLARDRS